MKKNAIVLFLTISFITIISTIVALYFTVTESSIKRTEKEQFLVQSNLFMYDIKNQIFPIFDSTIKTIFASPIAELLKEYADEEYNEERAKIDIYNDYIYNTPLPLQTESSNISATILCTPSNNKLNLNLFRDFNDTFRATFQERFKTHFANNYALLDPNSLVDLINYAVGATPKEESYLYMNENLEINELLKDKESVLTSKVSWNKLIKDYATLTNDTTIYEIPWDTLVGFQGDFLDFNQISEPLCQLIFPYASQNSLEFCGEPSRNRTKKSVTQDLQEDEKVVVNGLHLFFDFNHILDCKIDYGTEKVSGSFYFNYYMENNKSASKLENFSFTIR